MQAHVKVRDDALEPALFRQLLRAVQSLGVERLARTYQTTFWFDLKRPQCLPELVALDLLRHAPNEAEVVGVEWWLSRMHTTNVQVDFHQDRDEKLALRTGRLIHPLWSSVLFLNRSKGGLLAVTDAPPNEENVSKAPDALDFDLVAPKPNRFALFKGNLTHGVLNAKNQIPSGRLAGSSRLRLAIIFNWWRRPPEQTPTWSSTRIYRRLKKGDRLLFPRKK
jgi:hypothetical protein